MTRGSGLTGLAGMAPMSPLPVGGDRRDHARPPAARDPEGATRRHARARQDRFCRRCVEPRSALHAGAAARADAGARARGARRPPPGVVGPPLAARRCGDRRGGRRCGTALRCRERQWPDRGRSCSMPKNSAASPPKWPCACSAVRSRRPATRGRSELGKLEALYRGAGKRQGCCERRGFRLRRTLGGALVTLAAGRLTVERAPPRSAETGGANLTTAKYGRRGGPKRR